MKVELDLSNNATKTYLKNEMGVNTPSFAEYVDLDKLDIDNLKNVPTNSSSLKSKVDELDVDKLTPVSG